MNLLYYGDKIGGTMNITIRKDVLIKKISEKITAHETALADTAKKAEERRIQRAVEEEKDFGDYIKKLGAYVTAVRAAKTYQEKRNVPAPHSPSNNYVPYYDDGQNLKAEIGVLKRYLSVLELCDDTSLKLDGYDHPYIKSILGDI